MTDLLPDYPEEEEELPNANAGSKNTEEEEKEKELLRDDEEDPMDTGELSGNNPGTRPAMVDAATGPMPMSPPPPAHHSPPLPPPPPPQHTASSDAGSSTGSDNPGTAAFPRLYYNIKNAKLANMSVRNLHGCATFEKSCSVCSFEENDSKERVKIANNQHSFQKLQNICTSFKIENWSAHLALPVITRYSAGRAKNSTIGTWSLRCLFWRTRISRPRSRRRGMGSVLRS
jgi:hypothetical protein